MTNLFSIFDPNSWFWLPLNWASIFGAIWLMPCIYWTSKSQMIMLLQTLIKKLSSEFKTILQSNSIPGMLFLPLSFLMFIGLNNSLGLLPYVFTASSHFTFTLTLALPLWVGHVIMSWMYTPQLSFAHLVPLGTPVALMSFMVLIELISSMIRPFTLAIRLAANMVAGHLLLSLLAGQISSLSLIILFSLLIGLILLTVLECAVSLIQAYVFSVLSVLYVNEVNSPLIS